METLMSSDFAVALCKARTAMGAVVKSKANPAFRSKYADLADVLDEITEPLHANGISLFMPLINSEDSSRVGVIIQMIYVTGESYETPAFFIPIVKADAQGYIAASTYARRCFATSYFCLPTEDDDGNEASGQNRPAAPNRPSQSYASAAPAKPAPQPAPKAPEKVAPVVEMATQDNVTAFLKRFDKAYPAGVDEGGKEIGRPTTEALLLLRRAELIARFNAMPK
jgi:hypothetical protein